MGLIRATVGRIALKLFEGFLDKNFKKNHYELNKRTSETISDEDYTKYNKLMNKIKKEKFKNIKKDVHLSVNNTIWYYNEVSNFITTFQTRIQKQLFPNDVISDVIMCRKFKRDVWVLNIPYTKDEQKIKDIIIYNLLLIENFEKDKDFKFSDFYSIIYGFDKKDISFIGNRLLKKYRNSFTELIKEKLSEEENEDAKSEYLGILKRMNKLYVLNLTRSLIELVTFENIFNFRYSFYDPSDFRIQ